MLLAGLLAGCASGTGPDAQNDARRALAAAERPVLMTLVGNPSEMDEAKPNAPISSELAGGVTGMSAAFTSSAGAALLRSWSRGGAEPGERTGPRSAVAAPGTVRTAAAQEQVHIPAAFCRGDQVLKWRAPRRPSAGRRTSASGAAVADIERLFPDDYAETYGFGIPPRWPDFGWRQLSAAAAPKSRPGGAAKGASSALPSPAICDLLRRASVDHRRVQIELVVQADEQ